jgi:hypothetical protein
MEAQIEMFFNRYAKVQNFQNSRMGDRYKIYVIFSYLQLDVQKVGGIGCSIARCLSMMYVIGGTTSSSRFVREVTLTVKKFEGT